MKNNKKFEKELARSQIEIKEHTLKNIAWELHDNIGQLLSVANIQVNMLELHIPSAQAEQFQDTKEVVASAIQEVRSLSKTLNHDVVLKKGLASSIQTESERFNRLQFLNATFTENGIPKTIDSAHEIIIFRIVQEFFSNVIKHSKASTLTTNLKYTTSALHIDINDNGIGFLYKNNGLKCWNGDHEKPRQINWSNLRVNIRN